MHACACMCTHVHAFVLDSYTHIQFLWNIEANMFVDEEGTKRDRTYTSYITLDFLLLYSIRFFFSWDWWHPRQPQHRVSRAHQIHFATTFPLFLQDKGRVIGSSPHVLWEGVHFLQESHWNIRSDQVCVCVKCACVHDGPPRHYRPFPKAQRKEECLKALQEVVLEPGAYQLDCSN